MKTIIQKALDHTMNLGADACDIIVSAGESMSLSAQDGKLDKYNVAKTSILGLRVIKNQKIGLAYSESLDDDALHFAAKSALENSEFSDINEFETISVKNNSDKIKVSPSLDKSTNEERIEFALKLESEVKRKDPRVKQCPNNWREQIFLLELSWHLYGTR